MSTRICPIAEFASASPDAIACWENGSSATYAEMDRLITNLVNATQFEPGQRICFQSENSVNFVALYWAIFRQHAIACPISSRLDGPQANDMALQVDGTLLDAVTMNKMFSKVSESISGSPSSLPLARLRLDIPATIIFSSGTTGKPKAIVHDLRAHFCSAVGSGMNIPISTNDGWLLSLPTNHVGGLSILFRCAIAGATVVISSGSKSLVDDFALPCVTHVSLVATQLRRIMQQSTSLPPLKAVLLGGSALPIDLIKEACEKSVPLYSTYGLSEMASQVTTTSCRCDGHARKGTAGKVLPHREIRISDEGEILVRGETLFRGYFVDGEVCSATEADGWFPTRDLGRIDDQECLTVVGRKDNMFISGGENIHPEEIETCLLDCPGVEQAVVADVPCPHYGHRPVALVKSEQFDADALKEILAAKLVRFKCPDAIYPWPNELQFSSGIKVPRRQAVQYLIDLHLRLT